MERHRRKARVGQQGRETPVEVLAQALGAVETRQRPRGSAHERVARTAPVGDVQATARAQHAQRLEHLRVHGPTPFAFTFKARFPSPDADAEEVVVDDDVRCPA